MSRLVDLAEALKEELSKHYASVRLSSVQTQEQFLTELTVIPTGKMPAVVIVFDGRTLGAEPGVEEYRFTLVLIDRFAAGSDEKALSIFRAGATLLDLFPADGCELGECYVTPIDCIAASPDSQFAALALGICCKQSF